MSSCDSASQEVSPARIRSPTSKLQAVKELASTPATAAMGKTSGETASRPAATWETILSQDFSISKVATQIARQPAENASPAFWRSRKKLK
jgi:hypothetical protein